jgi:hypothetical protein
LPEDLARIAASIAALVDPSGIAGTIAAFTYAKCSKIFGSYSAEDAEQIETNNAKEEIRRYEVELSQKNIEEQHTIMEKAISEGKGNPEWYAPIDEEPKAEL